MVISRPKPLAWTVFRGTLAIRDGWLTSTALRGSAWTRIRSDVYADSRLDRDHALACHAAMLTLPADAVVAGASAAVLLGVEHAAAYPDPVHVIVPRTSSFGPRSGLVVHATGLDPGHVESAGVGRRTTALRTAWDVAVWQDQPSAVAIIDTMLGRGLVRPDDLSEFALGRAGTRGHRLASRAFALADGRSQSPPESRLRLLLVRAELPAPVPQCPVRVPGGLVLHPDLGWEEYRVALEYDGHWHANADQLHRDRRRLNLLQTAGWLVLHATSDRVRRDPAGLIREVRDALRSRGWPG